MLWQSKHAHMMFGYVSLCPGHAASLYAVRDSSCRRETHAQQNLPMQTRSAKAAHVHLLLQSSACVHLLLQSSGSVWRSIFCAENACAIKRQGCRHMHGCAGNQ